MSTLISQSIGIWKFLHSLHDREISHWVIIKVLREDLTTVGEPSNLHLRSVTVRIVLTSDRLLIG